nr:hypothetical protein [Succinivibrionaceae bacterium]
GAAGKRDCRKREESQTKFSAYVHKPFRRRSAPPLVLTMKKPAADRETVRSTSDGYNPDFGRLAGTGQPFWILQYQYEKRDIFTLKSPHA